MVMHPSTSGKKAVQVGPPRPIIVALSDRSFSPRVFDEEILILQQTQSSL
jgi:hypothetical protein